MDYLQMNQKLLLVLFFLLCFSNAGASNWQWLKNSQMESLSESDWQLLSETLQSGLETAGDGETLHWKNSQSGNGGKITILGNPSENNQCRQVHFNTASVSTSSTKPLTFCKTTEGKWMIDSNSSDKP
jgi:surface antigen